MERVTSRLGEVRLAPDGPVVAGSIGQWTVTLTVGSYGIDEGGTIKLAQRFAADWETPQFEHPKASGYTTVTTSGAARLRPYFHAKAHERPWMKCLVIDVFDGSLAPGDVVTIVLGDRSQGSPGIRAQTFQESAHEFRVLVDPTNASRAVSLPTSPKFPVMAGPPAALVCIVPSQARVGAAVEVFVKGEDQWGNPTAAPAQVELMWESDPSFAGDITIEAGSSIVASRPGRGWVLARAVTQGGVFSVRSNPIEFAAAETTATGRRSGPLQRYWGDLHAQSAGTVGTGDEDEYFTFARDAARLDFASHQGNDFQIDDEYWAHLNTTVAKFHEDGTFVVFPGYEWSANSPAGGDRNVFYRREGMPILRSSHWQIPHVPENELSPAHPADVLFRRLREHVSAADVLLGAHVGGRYADVRRYFDEERGGLVEVLSCWGVFEWMLWDALDKGYVVGVMCNSDGHKGRPGAEGPGAGEFGIRGGLTCVLAEAQTRDAIWRGLQARHCYGTSGARITLDFHAQSSDGSRYMMGDLISGSSGQLTLTASAVGCAPLESLTLFQGRQPLRTVRPAVFGRGEDSPRVRVGWAGSRIRGRGRRVTWDGEIQLTGAPILRAATVAFDAHSDGILAQDAQRVQFRSATTGDADMIDLWLADESRGVLTFHSQAGDATFDLTTLARVGERTEIDFGGLDMRVWVERYPDHLSEAEGNLALEMQVQCEPPEAVRTPYWVKAVQTDGQMAWSSPIYVAR